MDAIIAIKDSKKKYVKLKTRLACSSIFFAIQSIIIFFFLVLSAGLVFLSILKIAPLNCVCVLLNDLD
jgi:hypothetical protein